jgi:basic membrane lipoprotein Med (substrate-binding protein (PBP1-ABC) superfamily)
MAIEHDYFGVIDETASGGLAWNDTVDLADQAVEVELRADDEQAVGEYALDSAAALIQALEGFDARARDALVAELSSRQSATTSYIDEHVDKLGESLLDLLVYNSGDIAIDVLRSLQLLTVTVQADQAGEDEVFATFDYSISPDETDAILTVSFDVRGDVVAVDTQG